jgi:hypothetical protein
MAPRRRSAARQPNRIVPMSRVGISRCARHAVSRSAQSGRHNRRNADVGTTPSMCVFLVKGVAVAQICVGFLGSEALRRSRSASEVRRTNRVVHGPRRRRMALRRRLGLGRGVRAVRCADARDLLDTGYLSRTPFRGHLKSALEKVGVRSRRTRGAVPAALIASGRCVR